MSEYELQVSPATSRIHLRNRSAIHQSQNTTFCLSYLSPGRPVPDVISKYTVLKPKRHFRFILSYSVLSHALSAVRFYRRKETPFRNKGYTRDLEICHRCECQTPAGFFFFFRGWGYGWSVTRKPGRSSKGLVTRSDLCTWYARTSLFSRKHTSKNIQAEGTYVNGAAGWY